mgnify:CR=1 FL=1
MQKSLTAVLAIFLATAFGVTFAQTEPPEDSEEELALARTLLSNQRDRLEPMDARLVEPIEQLANQLMDLNQFDEAHALLDRAMQIVRVEDGLYTEQQRPLLKKKIDNFANRGDWESARESMEHLYWLYTMKSKRVDSALIEDLLELSRIHLRGLAGDTSFMQDYHFRQSARIRWIALGAAQKLWGETDDRLVPIVYAHLRQLHLQTVALWSGGSTSYALRKIAPGSQIMQDREDVNEVFYLTGLGLINNLYSIYARREVPDLEAMAMTSLYLADWHILYEQPEAATETYRQAYQELLAVGVSADTLNELFDHPMVIPDTEFYATVEEAVIAQRNRLVTEEEGNANAFLSFSEWSSSLPNVRSPIQDFASDAAELDSNFALFSFSLAGVNKVSRWYSHRFVSTVNMIEQAELLAYFLESPPEEQLLLAKLNSLTFRPKLFNGEPEQATGRLKYHFAPSAP